MRFVLKDSRLGLLNSHTRIPFRYGKSCLTACPQAVLEVTVEAGGKTQRGYAGDCFPPGWFDKTPGKSFRDQIDDMIAVTGLARQRFAEEASGATEFFPAWQAVYERVQRTAAEQGLQPLVASFGVSLVERAIMDALARAAGLSFARAVRENLYAIRPVEVHAELNGFQPADWLPAEPARSIYVRHTVGLGDPLTAADIPPEERVEDGFPQALEEYIERTGTRYFKVKVSNNLDADRERLLAIASLVERHRGEDYKLTLDGNEQYARAEEFDALVDMLRGTEKLRTLLDNTLAIEQPLERGISLDPEHTGGIRELGRTKPVIIDESDGPLDAYARALELGYRGVSSKNCKGPVRSLINAGLTWLRNDRGARDDYIITGEDLCTVGIVPVQADLCLVATLGLEHVERNGHHYHPGLKYLPEPQQRAALEAHADMYGESGGVAAPQVKDGRFEIGSLQCAGFGFAVEPDMDAYTPAEEWRFESLGL